MAGGNKSSRDAPADASMSASTAKSRNTRPEFLSEADNWYGVLDPKERKKIQDRLAQRARRKRLAEATRPRETTASTSSNRRRRQSSRESSEDSWDEGLDEFFYDINLTRKYFALAKQDFPPLGWEEDTSNIDPILLAKELVKRGGKDEPTRTDTFESNSRETFDPFDRVLRAIDQVTGINRTHSPPQSYRDYRYEQSTDPFFLSIPPIMVYAALWNNGICMDLKCVPLHERHYTQRRFAEPDSSVPPDLRPTDMQLTTFHMSWIDRFPFPKFRDNMIRYTNEDKVCPQDFFRDLFTTQSFELVPGGKSWDASSWRLFPQFADKWGFAFM